MSPGNCRETIGETAAKLDTPVGSAHAVVDDELEFKKCVLIGIEARDRVAETVVSQSADST
jgi:hypothetical protein